MKRLRKFYSTLLGRVSISLTLILLCSILLILSLNIHIYREQRAQTLSFLQSTLQNSSDVFSAQLETMSAFYQSMFANNVNYQQLKKPVSEQAFHLAATQLLRDMDDIFFSFSGISFTYCYLAGRDYLIQSSTHPNYERSELLKQYLKDRHHQTEGDLFTRTTWHAAMADGTCYLFNTIRQKDVEFGIVLDANSLLLDTHLLEDLENGVLYFTEADGTFLSGISQKDGIILPCTEEDTRRRDQVLVECQGTHASLRLCLQLPEQTILGGLQRQIRINVSILLVVLISTFFLIHFLFYHFTAKPVENIAAVARKLGSGELDQRLPETGALSEICEINRNFNQLIGAITTLKIDLYEEKLRHQEAELAQLRLQLNPHFLLNSLNLVYTMTRQRHYDVAMQFCLCLIRHFRFVLKKNHNFVPLADELDFCANYMEILSLQYPSYFFYEITLDDQSLRTDALLPPLSIENLIENAVKYGLTQEEPLHIRIRIAKEDRDGYAYTLIEIRDDGPGYSEDALSYIRRIQDGDQAENLASDGVGLKNLIERLRILYEGNASLSFQNDNGAYVHMAIPLVWPQKRNPE